MLKVVLCVDCLCILRSDEGEDVLYSYKDMLFVCVNHF